MSKFQIGDTVRLTREAMTANGVEQGERGRAVVRGFYDSIPGGLWVEPEIDGFRSWNEADLEPLPSDA